MNEITRDKILSILSYFSICFIIPLIISNCNKIAKFHAKQGLVLFLYNLLGNIIIMFLSFNIFTNGIFIMLITAIFSLSVFIFSLIGVYNAALLKKNKLPIIGAFSKMFD